MVINRRRAPKSEVSRKKKLDGHAGEREYVESIGGEVVPGVAKGDVKDCQRAEKGVRPLHGQGCD